MRRLRMLAGEVTGLLVDDRWLAGAVVIWLLLVRVALSRLHLGGTVSGVVLFAGSAAVLIGSVLRQARG